MQIWTASGPDVREQEGMDPDATFFNVPFRGGAGTQDKLKFSCPQSGKRNVVRPRGPSTSFVNAPVLQGGTESRRQKEETGPEKEEQATGAR